MTTDYRLVPSEMKGRQNTNLAGMHLSDEIIDLLICQATGQHTDLCGGYRRHAEAGMRDGSFPIRPACWRNQPYGGAIDSK